jgi:hypothetical protein
MTAKLTCDEEGSVEMARGRVKAVRKYPFWIERKGTGTKLEDIQSVATAVREARQGKVAYNANVRPWVKIRDGPDAARKSRTKAFWARELRELLG